MVLNWKVRMREVIEHAKEMPPKERLLYLWEYFGGYAIALAVVLGLFISVIVSIVTQVDPLLEVVMVDNSVISQSDEEAFADFFEKYGYETEHRTVQGAGILSRTCKICRIHACLGQKEHVEKERHRQSKADHNDIWHVATEAFLRCKDGAQHEDQRGRNGERHKHVLRRMHTKIHTGKRNQHDNDDRGDHDPSVLSLSDSKAPEGARDVLRVPRGEGISRSGLACALHDGKFRI